MQSKRDVLEFWNQASCGETYLGDAKESDPYEAAREARYRLEPYIPPFADFDAAHGEDILEVGVGMGADHWRWARAKPHSLSGVDLTPRAVEHTQRQLAFDELESDLRVADAESLPFDEESFDRVYSWGVLHHSPNTEQAFREVWRVLRPGGIAKLMIYHSRSVTGWMLWMRYALMAGKPWRSFADIYDQHLESPGTKAYSLDEARELCRDFSNTDIRVQLNHGELLMGDVGQRHKGWLLTFAKAVWPRALIRRFCGRYGLYLMITARK